MTQRRIIGATVLALTVLILGAAVEAVPQIERRLEANVSDILVRNGAGWASVAVDGRTVTLTGVPQSHEARLSVVALVRRVPGVSEVKPLVSAPIGLRQPDREVRPSDPAETSDPAEGGSARVALSPSPEPQPLQTTEPRLAMLDEVTAPLRPAPTRVETESCAARLTRFAEERTLAFEPRGAAIAEQDKLALIQTAEALRGCREWTLTLVAYAGEDEGTDSWALADQRAYAVARFFMQRGVDESRLATVTGNGSSRDDDFARVEIFVSGGP
ncbi:MAG: OmpA family protein [Longimicrobiales bacterium]